MLRAAVAEFAGRATDADASLRCELLRRLHARATAALAAVDVANAPPAVAARASEASAEASLALQALPCGAELVEWVGAHPLRRRRVRRCAGACAGDATLLALCDGDGDDIARLNPPLYERLRRHADRGRRGRRRGGGGGRAAG